MPSSVDEHTYTEYQQINSKIHKKICVCGDAIEEEHAFDEWEMLNHQNHKEFCRCGQSVTEKHVFGEWATADANNHKRMCLCGAEETEAHMWDDGENGRVCTACSVLEAEVGMGAETLDANNTAVQGDSQLGCDGSLNDTYAVLVLIMILGFAFVAKKKESE